MDELKSDTEERKIRATCLHDVIWETAFESLQLVERWRSQFLSSTSGTEIVLQDITSVLGGHRFLCKSSQKTIFVLKMICKEVFKQYEF